MTSEITDWLDALGLAQYSENFEAHHIDMTLLHDLTHNNLTELGVESLGHRLKLLKAIEDLAPSDVPPTNRRITDVATDSGTERRQLTVMFCDLVDSTALAGTLDAEDLRHVITAYQGAAEPVVKRYGGHIAQYLGDGLLVYFGYPEAHEDDAIRAVHAGLDLLGQMQALNSTLMDSHKVSLSIRIGIHTGPVVVGQIGSDENSSFLATGSTPNIAAHLQQQAPDDSVVVSQVTQSLLGKVFLLDVIDGDVFQVRGTQLLESRFAATGRRSASRLVDRQYERSLLQQLWTQARAGKGHAVHVSGEAGIGKSLMVQVLCDDIAGSDHHRIVYQCSPYHMDSPLYPTRRQLMRALLSELAGDDTPTLDNLEALLAKVTTDPRRDAHMLADLVGLEEEAVARYGELTGTSLHRREQTLDTLLNQLLTMAGQHPVLIIFEDVQWSDATTLELARRAIERIDALPVLMLLTSRSDDYPEWCQASMLQLMPLRRLGVDGVREIVSQVTGTRSLPDSWVEQIVDRSDGVPLFAEELTRAMSQDSLVDESGVCVEPAGSAGAPIPASLHDSLIARLDKMRGVKPVAQMAACIGREFSQRDLAALAAVAHADLTPALERLQSEEIVQLDRSGPGGTYLFRHALLRDAAYESLPKSKRKALHSQYLDVLLEHSGSSPAVLAYHALEACRYREAAQQFDTAGLHASGRAAFEEAIAHFERAVSCTHSMANTPESRRMELDARVHQGHASTGLNGFAHPATIRCNAQARALLDQVGESPYTIPVLYGHWVIQHASGQHHNALNDANRLHKEVSATQDRIKQMVGQRIRGSTRLMMGDIALAKLDLQNAVSLYDESDWQSLVAQFGMDLGAPLFTSLALVHVCQGEAETAIQLLDGLEERVLGQAHPGTMLYALSHLALVHQCGALPSSEHFVEAADQLASKLQVVSYRGHTLGIKAMWLLEQGDVSASVDCMTESLTIIDRTKTYLYTPLLYGSYAYALARQGKVEASRTAADTAMEQTRSGGERWAMAEVQRLCALSAALHGASLDVTLRALDDAMNVAEGQGARLWSLRIAVSRAEVLVTADRGFEAQAHLADVVAGFPVSGRGLQNYQAACALLDRIRLPLQQ